MTPQRPTTPPAEDSPAPDYLWDRSGPPDEAVRRLEALLTPYRYRPDARERPSARSRRRLIVLPGLAAAAVVAMAAGVSWFARPAPAPGWDIVRYEGSPLVAERPLGTGGRPRSGSPVSLRVGQWLTTDAASSVELALDGVGRVTVDPDSRVRLLRSAKDEQRLELARGRLEAFVITPPRVFFVQTPAATAIDYGCKYAIETDEAGAGLLRVTLGLVKLESTRGESVVPRGALCRVYPGAGPGTPVFADADPEFRSRLAALDDALVNTAVPGSPAVNEALSLLLRAPIRPRDALTLWHLLRRLDGPAREAAYDALAALAPPPEGVTRDGALALDRAMLDQWWTRLEALF